MGFVLDHFLPLFLGSIGGYITTYAMEFIDDFLKLTAKLPDSAKQLCVLALAALVTAANQQFAVHMPTDWAGFFGQPNIQFMITAGLAFFLKHAKQAKQAPALPAPVNGQ